MTLTSTPNACRIRSLVSTSVGCPIASSVPLFRIAMRSANMAAIFKSWSVTTVTIIMFWSGAAHSQALRIDTLDQVPQSARPGSIPMRFAQLRA